MISPLRLLSLAFATATAVSANLTPKELVSSIKDLTARSLALQDPANKLNLLNGPMLSIGQGPLPKIVTGLTQIVTIIQVDITQLKGTPPFDAAADQKAVADALTEFIQVHQALLSILIGNAGLLKSIPLIGGPVAAVLRQIEALVDEIAFAIVALIGGQGPPVMDQMNQLDVTLTLAVAQYTFPMKTGKRSYPIAFEG